MRVRRSCVLAVVTTVALWGCGDTDTATEPSFGKSANATTVNAQSVMFKNEISNLNFETGDGGTWAYDRAGAAQYFSNTLTSGPAVTCTGGGRSGCDASNQPAAPTAPAPDPDKLDPPGQGTGILASNACNFFTGDPLTVPGGQSTYTRSVTVPGVNNDGSWKFTWTYEITPLQESYPAHTGWTFTPDGSGGAMLTVAGFFAGQSVVQANEPKSRDWSLKVSHTMSYTDAFGVVQQRIINPAVSLYLLDSNGDPVLPAVWSTPLTTALMNDADFIYTMLSNSYNGPVGLLFNGALAMGAIQAGTWGNGDGRLDNFAGNNTVLPERAQITDDPSFTLTDAGFYKLAITGTVKGVAGLADLQLNVTQGASNNVCQ